MKAVELRLRNVLSFAEWTLHFGEKITWVRASNGAGKTNLTNALLSFIDGGHDATLLRTGASEGEAVWVLSDDGKPWTLREEITPTRTAREVSRPDSSKEGATQAFIRSILDGMAANPVKFIQATPQERAKVFLQQMQVKLTPERLAQAGITNYPPAILQAHGLDALKQLNKLLVSQREGIGGEKRKAAETAETLRRGLPPERPSVEQDLADARQRLADKQGELAGKATGINDMEKAQRDEITLRYFKQRNEIDRQIQALLSQKREIEAAEKAELSEIRASASKQLDRYRQQMAGDIEALTAEVATLQEQRDAEIRARETRDLIARHQVDAEELQKDWNALQEQIRQLEVIQGELLQALPIKNVEVIDGEIYRDGVPFHRWNEQKQWALAFQMAKLRAGKLPFVVVDGIQFLDPQNRAAFQQAAESSGLQFLVTEVNQDCECGHPVSVHDPKCNYTGCDCTAPVDPGMVVERVGEIPALFEMTQPAATRARRRR